MSATSFVPKPPKLAYMNDGLKQSRAASASTRRSRPGTAGTAASSPAAGSAAAAASSRPTTAGQRHKRTFLQDNQSADRVLPQPLPPGIPYVASFTTYEDLLDRKILHQSETQQVHLTTDDVRIIYEGKCEDQSLKASWAREMRFLELISSSCRGQFFTLRENGLGPLSSQAISSVLASNESFTILDLSGNRIRDPGAASMATLLESNDTLVHISLKSNDIGADGMCALATALTRNNTLTSLDLGGIRGVNRNHVGARGAEALGNMLMANAVLHTLDLSSNGLGIEGTGLIASGLQENTSLRSLKLACNNIGPDGCRLLASVLQGSCLEHVDLSRNAIGDAGAGHVALAFQAGTEGGEHIVELRLDSNDIRDIGCRSLAPMLRTNVSLKKLHLNHNDLGTGMVDIADALRDNRCITVVKLVDCGLREAEALALASTFTSPTHLQTVAIDKNRLGDKGCAALLKALSTNRRLQVLSMSGCAAGNDSGRALAEMLKTNATLVDINMRQNLMSGESGHALQEELRANSTVRSLDLTFNDIPYLCSVAIDTVLKANNDAWRHGEEPRLEAEIERLDYAQKDLFQVEEEMESERRAIKERGDELVRRKDTARGQQESHKRVLTELQDKHAVLTSRFNDKQDNYRQKEEATFKEQTRLEQKVSQLQNKIDIEREKREKIGKDTERARKHLRMLEEQEEAALKPLKAEYERADTDRASERVDARQAADALMALELRMLQLERTLYGDRAAGGRDTPKGNTPRQGSASRRRSKP